MRIRSFILAASFAALTLSAQPATPRKAPEFTIVDSAGKTTLLSSYRGKVVALAFIFTTCPHCQAECGVLSKLQGELGDKGFQPIAVAFNPDADKLVKSFVQTFRPSFPVAHADRASVVSYLQLKDDDDHPWNVPQIALIDRKGMIVAQSAPKGSEDLQLEDPLRKKITELLGPAPKTMLRKASH